MNLAAKNEPGDTPEAPTRRERLRAFWMEVLEGSGTGSKVLVWVLVACFTAGSAWLLVPDRSGPKVSYTRRDIGSFSNGVVKADRDYTIPDVETTRVKAEAARKAVLPVYDHDYRMGDRAARRVQEAFALMRSTYQALLEKTAEEAQPAPPEEEGEGAAAPPAPQAHAEAEGSKAKETVAKGAQAKATVSPGAEAQAAGPETAAPPAPVVPDEEAVRAAFGEHKAEFLQILQVVVDDDEFATLVRARFSKEVEDAIVALVRKAMHRLVVADRELIAAVKGQTIVVQRVPDRDPRFERKVEVVEGEVTDVAAVREAIDTQVRKVLPGAPRALRKVVRRLARRLVGPNLVYNPDETQARRDKAAAAVKPVVIQVARGERIIGDGERIEPRHILIFEGMRKEAAGIVGARYFAGAALMVLLLSFALYSFALGSVWRFRPSHKDLIFLVVALLSSLLATRGGVFLLSALADRFPQVATSAFYYAIPIAAAPILVRLVLPGEVTLVFAAVLSVLVGLIADSSLAMTAYVFAVSVVGADMVRRAKDRSSIWRAGLVVGLIGSVLAIGLGLMTDAPTLESVAVSAASAATTFITVPFAVLGLTWIVENVFGYTTDFKLLELANVNNRLLKELVVAAPGTYQHSMVIGSIVEPAAEAIGANPLLARVGAYYHDIGKGRNPRYFAENQKGVNPHDELTPSMSALIIRRHVSDGIKMAREAGLPTQIVDMIPMHHGTRLMSYFWHKAREEAEKKGEAPPDEVEYRHVGPRPRFREAALLMIADSVEAAARTVTEPNRDRFLGMIQKVINTCFADGQFDECDITLKDLHAVARSFASSLEAIYHSRPEYQEPADKSDRSRPAKERNGAAPKTEEPPARRGEGRERRVASEGGEGAGASPKKKRGASSRAKGEARGDTPEAPEAPAPADEDRTLSAEALDETEEIEGGEALKRLGTGQAGPGA